MFDYNRVVSISVSDFSKLYGNTNFEDPEKFTKSDQEDVAKIERILDVSSGFLANYPFYLAKNDCECGRRLTFYDFVFTALIDGNHPKSFILHTLIGAKLVANEARSVRCSNCCRTTDRKIMYGMPSSYLCRDGSTI